MTKSNARAIMAARQAILTALDRAERKLRGDDLTYFQNYWGAHVRKAVDSNGYGCAPVARAMEVLE